MKKIIPASSIKDILREGATWQKIRRSYSAEPEVRWTFSYSGMSGTITIRMIDGSSFNMNSQRMVIDFDNGFFDISDEGTTLTS